MANRTVNLDAEAADAAWKKFLAEVEEANPALEKGGATEIPTPIVRQMLRTTFYFGFEAGENNALSKIPS